jgi:hypothetical protein
VIELGPPPPGRALKWCQKDDGNQTKGVASYGCKLHLLIGVEHELLRSFLYHGFRNR